LILVFIVVKMSNNFIAINIPSTPFCEKGHGLPSEVIIVNKKKWEKLGVLLKKYQAEHPNRETIWRQVPVNGNLEYTNLSYHLDCPCSYYEDGCQIEVDCFNMYENSYEVKMSHKYFSSRGEFLIELHCVCVDAGIPASELESLVSDIIDERERHYKKYRKKTKSLINDILSV
jgi:hypothetical protein